MATDTTADPREVCDVAGGQSPADHIGERPVNDAEHVVNRRRERRVNATTSTSGCEQVRVEGLQRRRCTTKPELLEY
jgi:hypothetical protein